ncbi:MAG: aldehyde dehydrogenase [Halobacteriovorax sp.]|nr:aldehyde dehydrogenase [Halobacteriovorax sp.]|tara:strand:+ start:521386 stop:522759 length:1374 start_codon:yes stop_codon:yes gene_type:complete
MQEIQTLFEKQKNFFLDGKTQPLEARKESLKRLINMIEENEASIFKALESDLGKSNFESFIGETGYVAGEARHAIKKLKKWMKKRRVSSPLLQFPARSYIQAEPLGVTLIISPWNYPFQLLFSPLVGALAAGNTAILKPSEVAPATSKLAAELVPKYFREEQVAVVEGEVPETTALLKLNFDYIFYTGNEFVGKIVMEAAAKHLTPVTLELGGKSPCGLFEVHNMELAVRRIVWGKYFNSGQTCVAPDYLLVKKGKASEVAGLFKKIVEEFYRDPSTSEDYGRIVNARHFKRLDNMLVDEKLLVEYGKDSEKLFMGPVLLEANEFSKSMESEIFGPILPIIEFENIREAIKFVRSKPKPLASYIFSDSDNNINDWRELISSGGLCINDTIVHLSSETLPFGGVGSSGMGSYHGQKSFDTFSHLKSIMKRYLFWDLPLRYPPYGGKLSLIRKIFRIFS